MENKFNSGIYVFGFLVGIATGLSFSQAAYHKGKKDAYEDVGERLQKVIDNIVDEVDECLDKTPVEVEES